MKRRCKSRNNFLPVASVSHHRRPLSYYLSPERFFGKANSATDAVVSEVESMNTDKTQIKKTYPILICENPCQQNDWPLITEIFTEIIRGEA